jgi:hypothetical protein
VVSEAECVAQIFTDQSGPSRNQNQICGESANSWIPSSAQRFVSIRVHSWLSNADLGSLRGLRERRKRFVDRNPWQLIFEPDHFLWRKRRGIIERRNREIDRVGVFVVLEKQVRAATCSKGADPFRIRNFARFTFCNHEIFAGHRSPSDIGRAGAAPAIDAMTIDQRKRPALQHVSCPAANASTSNLHKICLAK